MGIKVNGARTWLNVLRYACRLSRLPGFLTGLNAILGSDRAASWVAAWEPLCLLVDAMVAADDYFNQRDTVNDDGPGEDAPFAE
jgi:hypothetical protein